MTPASKLLKKHNIDFTIHEYEHDKTSASYGLEASEKLQVSSDLVFKTLVVQLDTQALIIAILPVAEKLSMKLVAKAFNAKKAKMADKDDVFRNTGYIMGGVSPLGQKKRLKTIIHCSAFDGEKIFVSAGKRGLELEMKPLDLQKLLIAKSAHICA